LSADTELNPAVLLAALQSMRNGDFSVRLPGDWTGLAGKIADTFNDVVIANDHMAAELQRVSETVGRRGQTRERVRCERRVGSWGAMESSVNGLVDDLLWPTTAVTRSIAAVAQGDLSETVPLEVDGQRIEGEFLRSAQIVNRMIEQMRVFTFEVTRVAREVGAEGTLGGQAVVRDVSGVWKDLTDNVNSMANHLTAQVRNISEVTIAVANGDLSRKITVDVRGEMLQLKDAINTMVDQLRSFASEVTRVAREVGTEGKLGGQAAVPGVAGTWKDLTDNVNVMATNLTDQVRGIAEVATAIARGDLSRKITVDVKGELLELKDTINTVVDQLNSFAAEVTRVAREVGTEGKLGGQAKVPGVAGTWKDLTDNVNSMAGNLTAQVRNIAEVTTAVARGDLSRKITVNVQGEILELKNTINTMVDQLNSFASEVTRVAREVGTEGELGGQAAVPGVAGTWKGLTDNVNVMAANLTNQVREIAEVATAIARGDLSRKITVDVKGEILELKNTINTLVDQLNGFAAEVTRVARDVGTEGKLGGQATVPGVAGTWKDLTDNVNVMAENLTNQVRGIVKVVTAVAHGDLTQKLTVESKGEVAALAKTINSMTDTLAIFADQVTTVAREVGVEGRLGGQANVPGAAGTWKDLTANVNLLAANLTTQVRAIADVATAVTKGDLTRFIQVDASGEVADLKNYINAMIGNLRQTTDRNTEQDWLKTHLANFSRRMQGQRDLYSVAEMLLSELAPLVGAQQGIIYVATESAAGPRLKQVAAYADSATPDAPREYAFNEGLIGQCARERKALHISDVPANSIRISSGIVDVEPRNLIVLPVLFEDKVRAVIELASIDSFTPSHIAFLEQLADIIGVVINNIEGTMRTERLLAQSQQLATEQQMQQRELQKTNEELAQKAQLLAAQNAEVERKNQEIEQARRALEEKAAELALTSRYKSEFLANMSHELRTPLNSILVLGQQLADNAHNNLTPRQVEFASTIRAAGTDLLNLISDILDLSKIESGTVTVDSEEFELLSLKKTVERTFRHESQSGRVSFTTEFGPSLCKTIQTDPKRLLQVLKNLLANSFKFTERGSVKLRVSVARKGWTPGHPILDRARSVVAFSVSDTGIGIAPDKQKIVFEAFQQGDAGTARKHGGTGLGLAISRELAQLLGGEITLYSRPGSGSTFTLYLPASYAGPALHENRGSSTTAATTGTYAAMLTAAPRTPAMPDDREDVSPGDRVLLVVQKDPVIAGMVIEAARASGMKAVATARGADALALARQYRPEAISVDISLPDMHGWTVLSRIKHDPELRHIPVQMFTDDANSRAARTRGACSTLQKPVSAADLYQDIVRMSMLSGTAERRLLVAAGGARDDGGIAELAAGEDVETTLAADLADAMRWLLERQYGCVVVDATQPQTGAIELLKQAALKPEFCNLPFVVYADGVWIRENRQHIDMLARTMIVRLATSPGSVLDECSLFLHRRVASLPADRQRMLLQSSECDVLSGKSILIVDDDVRNIFALSSLLERHDMHVISAQTGRNALQLIDETESLSLVLLDVMMPELDGFETMRRMRTSLKFDRPIIALTAKAMTGDREKCIEAGASDYIAKPVDSEHLVSLLCVWLDR
jgi:signal transduction histidine kinase/HAMP domain-containing protein/DNA-binding response OmpR family regulator